MEMAPFDSVHDDLMSWLVAEAKQRKLRVLLTPRLEVENEGLHSGGAIKPSNWEHWWWSYRRVALHYARYCSMHKVSAYAIGSELSSTELQADRWRKLIKEARKIFTGDLTYLSAADSVERVPFWDALDHVGVVVDQAQPRSEGQLQEGLGLLLKRLNNLPKARELGYLVAEAGCGRGAPDAGRELVCQAALFQSLRDEPRLEGVYLLPAADLTDRVSASDEPKAAIETSSDIVSHWYRRSKS